jgi:glycosyltransferase involved in cell wall biosynthesis
MGVADRSIAVPVGFALASLGQPIVPRIVIILPCGLAFEHHESMVESLAEIGKASSVSFVLVAIETPTARLHRNSLRAKLGEEARVSLSFIEAEKDDPAALIEATNKALRLAVQAKLDAIVMGSRVLLNPEAILELRAVGEQDPMVGFVEASTDEDKPRPRNQRPADNRPPSAHQGAPAFAGMPRSSYVPVFEGALVLIKSRVLQEFDLLDCVFGSRAAALNDLALRANRCGYRIVRANHVRVALGQRERADKVSEERDAEILHARFPYLEAEIARYENSPDARARKLLAGLSPDADGRLNIVFDCNNIGNLRNGTTELAKRIIAEVSLHHFDQYNIHVLCSRDAFDFHNYGELNGVIHLSGLSREIEKSFFASIRLVQPFKDEDIAFLANLAPVTMVLILDTIAIDCMQIGPGLTRIWERMLKSISALGFISDFSRVQFERRFSPKGDHLGFTALCSTDSKEYSANETAGAPRDDGYVLLVGNPYEHKFLKASCDHFRREAPEMKLVVLGLKMPDDERIMSYESGQLNDEAVADLYARASLVFFPSHCEGFGLPIMHGLARRKPVVARDLPVFREIQQRIHEAPNLHLFETTVEMVRFVAARPAWDNREAEPPLPLQSWADMAKAMRDALVDAGKRITYRGLRDRLLEAQACREIVELEAIRAQQARELAEMKLTWEPPPDEADMPGQAARFAAKRLEGRLRRFLEWRWTYSLTRLGWGVVKRLRQ